MTTYKLHETEFQQLEDAMQHLGFVETMVGGGDRAIAIPPKELLAFLSLTKGTLQRALQSAEHRRRQSAELPEVVGISPLELGLIIQACASGPSAVGGRWMTELTTKLQRASQLDQDMEMALRHWIEMIANCNPAPNAASIMNSSSSRAVQTKKATG